MIATGSTADMGNWGKKIFLENQLEMKILAAGILAVVLWQIVIRKFPGSKSRLNLPPGPLNLPVVGAMFSVETNIVEWHRKLAQKFGKIFYFRLGSHGMLVVCSAKGAEEVLRTKDALFANRPINGFMKSAAKYVGFDSEDILFANMNEKQKNLKKLLITNFFTMSKLNRFENIRRREGRFLVEDLQRQMTSKGIINVSESFLDMTVNLLCSLVFGRRYTDSLTSETDQLKHCREIVHDTTTLATKPNLGDLFPWLGSLVNIQGLNKELKDYNQHCHRVLWHLIEEHRETRRSNKNYIDQDFLDILLTLHDEGKITENAIPGSILDMLVGGSDTAAITTEWAVLEIVKNPDHLSKLQKEMDEVVGKERAVEESDFPNLPYLQAVILETFRLHTPAPLLAPHFTAEATTVQGFDIPANTTVFLNAALIARDPLIYKDPEHFNPERFMNAEKITVTDGNVFSLIPFGSGRWKCPAAVMGFLTVQRVLATVFHAFDLSPPPGMTKDDIDTTESITSVARPKTPLLLRAKLRLNPTVYSSTLD